MRHFTASGGPRSLARAALVCLSIAATTAAADSDTLEEVQVTASVPSIADEIAAAARVPGGITVLDMAQLGQRRLVNVAGMLRYVPGVWSDSATGGQSSFFSSRGSNLDATDFDRNGVKLLLDGLPVTTADGNNHNREIDPLSARSATVARGANAMAFGASTLGGAINFISPTAHERPGLSLRVDGGSHDFASARATAAGVAGALDGLITLESYTWGGFREHNREERNGAYTNVGWQFSERLSTRFYGTWVDNDQELPGALTREQFAADPDQASPGALGGDLQLNVGTWRIANRTSWQPRPGQRWEFGLSLEEQSLFHPIVDQILVDFDGPGPQPPTEVFSLLIDTEHRDIGAMTRFAADLGAHDLLFGINYGQNEVDGGHYRNAGGRRNGLRALIDDRAETWEFFLQDRWALSDTLALTLAAQGVHAERRTRSEEVASGEVTRPSGSYTAFNPRLGVIWQVRQGAALYGNVSRLYEPPTHFELRDDLRGGDAPLEAMHGYVIEAGTRGDLPLGSGGALNWDVALYYAAVRDEILSRDDPEAPGTSLSTNVDRTVHAGVEALLAGHCELGGSTLSLEPTLSVTLNEFRFDDDVDFGDNRLPAAPDFALRGEVLLRHASGIYAGPTFDLIGERWADFGNTFHIEDYRLLGLRAGYDAARWRIFLEGVNLLDTDYVATHGVRDIAAPDAALLQRGAPRSVYAGLEFTF